MNYCRTGYRGYVAGAVLALAAWMGVTPAASAAESYRQALARVAADVAKLVTKHDLKSVAIAPITGSPMASIGPGLAQTVQEELTVLGVPVSKIGEATLRGDYRVKKVTHEGRTESQLDLRLRLVRSDDDETELQSFKVDVLISDAVPPENTIDGTVIRCAGNNSLGIEIKVDEDARVPESKRNLAFVELKREEQYAVKLINDSDKPVAATVFIDGLSMFAFCTERNADGPNKGKPRYEHVSVPAKGSHTIKGWYRNRERTDRFRVTEYAQGAVHEVGNTGQVGLITVTFFHFEDPKEVASEESPKPRSVDATGFGEAIKVKYKEEHRFVGKQAGSVGVRYLR